jgi:hypothetical protein
VTDLPTDDQRREPEQPARPALRAEPQRARTGPVAGAEPRASRSPLRHHHRRTQAPPTTPALYADLDL